MNEIISIVILVKDAKKAAENLGMYTGGIVGERNLVDNADYGFKYKGMNCDFQCYCIAVYFDNITIEYLEPIGDGTGIWHMVINEEKREGILQLNLSRRKDCNKIQVNQYAMSDERTIGILDARSICGGILLEFVEKD